MANEPIQGLPYPLPSDTNDPPRDIKALADATVSRTNMRFATAGARDAAITAPVDGMECFVGTGSTAVKQVRLNGAWREAFSIRTVTVAATSPYTGSVTLTRDGAWVEAVFNISGSVPSGGAPTVASGAPADFRPVVNRTGAVSLTSGYTGLGVATTDGSFAVGNQTGGTRTAVTGSMTYRVV